MCGIAGYIGTHSPIIILLNILESLEYRGYDSAGFAYIKDNKIQSHKTINRIKSFNKYKNAKITNTPIIGHTRWATNGKVSINNAHPHFDNNNSIALVHNGIIENAQELIKKYNLNCKSDTDSEIIPCLISKFDIKKTVNLLKGYFSFIFIKLNNPDKIYAVRHGLPLIIGKSKHGYSISSDLSSLPQDTDQYYTLKDQSITSIALDNISTTNFDNKILQCNFIPYEKHQTNNKKNTKYNSTLEHEINEQLNILPKLLKRKIEFQLPKKSKILIVGCGSAYNAGLFGKFIIEDILSLPTTIEYSSQLHYLPSTYDLVILISQSGETKDTIDVAKQIQDIPKIGICNVENSYLSTLCDQMIYTESGFERSVAATKSLTSQMLIFIKLALENKTQNITIDNILLKLALTIPLPSIPAKGYILIGHDILYSIAKEGALKLVELTYKMAQSYPANELKHGPLALINKDINIILIGHSSHYTKLLNTANEIKLRDGRLILIVDKKLDLDIEQIIIPSDNIYIFALLATIIIQRLTLNEATRCNNDIDRPRHLAKSVTVN